MKKLSHAWLLASIFLFGICAPLFAQDKIEIDRQQASGFLEKNWIIIVLVVIAVLVFMFSGSSRRKSTTTTTVEKDDLGNVKRVETTKVQD